jgi:hypothetical protein
MQSDNSEAFRLKLYKQKVIFPFKWQKWYEGQNALQDANADLSNCNLLQLSMYFSLIFRADRFSDGTIQHCLDNSVLDKMMKRGGDYLKECNKAKSEIAGPVCSIACKHL